MTNNVNEVPNPELRLEDVREEPTANRCNGRGRSTAAARGYNVERLAYAVLNTNGFFYLQSDHDLGWYDTHVIGSLDPFPENPINVECKSCVYRYPSGGYGRFRIWQKNHTAFECLSQIDIFNRDYAYFFLVYKLENNKEKEVGKAVVPVSQVDSVLDNWNKINHDSMGEQYVRDISWHLLFKRLGISPEEFKHEDIIYLL